MQNVHSLSIGDLREGITYLVHVQALSRAGAGRVASIHFTTPLLQRVPVGTSCTDNTNVITIQTPVVEVLLMYSVGLKITSKYDKMHKYMYISQSQLLFQLSRTLVT